MMSFFIKDRMYSTSFFYPKFKKLNIEKCFYNIKQIAYKKTTSG